MCDKENCNCGSNPCCGDCEPWNCVEQAVNDVWATKETQIEGLVDRAETAAENSEASAKASADSAAEAKEFRDEAETAATTAVAAEGVVLGVANTLQDTADKLKQIADELNSAIAGISVVTWHYTAVSDNQTVIPVPVDKNQVDVQAIYIEGARQEPNRGFTYDALNKEITLAEGIPLGLEISIIIGTYSDNPNDFAGTLASNNGASLVGTSRGITVQQTINELDRSFQDGGVLRSPNDTLLDKSTNPYQEYVWTGDSSTFPKVVPAGSTPLSTGGIANGAWVSVGDASFRRELSANDGFKFIGSVPSMAALKTQEASFDGQLIQLRSWNAGLNLGGGIFQWDAASTKPDDSGCVVQVTGVSTGRWIRQGVVDKTPEMFGAIGNGINDDTTSLQAMFNSANNSQILGENFFGTFDLRHKYKTTESLNCGRPIKVDAYGAEFICTGSYPCVNFAMHNGEWSGGYFNYETLTDAQVNENAIAMQLIPNEVAPISVQNSIIKGLRIWGAHTGIGFKNNTGAEIWGLIFESMEIGIRPGISTVKAKGLSFEGKGGSTTISCRNINIHRRGSSVGAGSTAFFSIGVNEVDYYNVAYDGFFDEELGYCKVGPKEIFDVTAFRCNVIGFHTEKLYIDVDTFGECPMFFNCNSFSITGVEHLATYGTRGAAWMTIAGNNVATVGTWHELSSLSPQVNARVVNLLEWDRSGMINLTGNVKESDIIGGASRIPLYSPGPSSYGTNRDVTGPSGTIIFDLNTDYSAMVITAVGHQVSSTDLSFMSTIQLHYNPTGGWQVSHQTTKSQNFSAAVMNYGVSGNQLVFLLSGNTNDFRIQCRVETLRSLLTSF